ncbi:hypothetical protein BY458DRAFT_516194 [Sporodiniella umbellata]|nr:hypothetical protein BY458DRAFT_516194 [Sporodiniella umbellata]
MTTLLKTTTTFSQDGDTTSHSIKNSTLSAEMIHLLQAAKHMSLNVLSLMLKDMVEKADIAQSQSLDLMDSITQNTSLLLNSSSIENCDVPTDIKGVHTMLESHVSSDKTYTLCCALAALLNNIYQLLESNERDEGVFESKENSVLQLQEQLYLIQELKSSTSYTTNVLIWEDVDRLIELICQLIQEEAPTDFDESVYSDMHASSLINSNRNEVDCLIMTIQQLVTVMPPLNNQRANMPSLKSNHEKLLDTVERLQSRRMDNQRVHIKQGKDMLQYLIQQIQTLASRSFDNQRVLMKPMQNDIQYIVERMQRRRYSDQDATSYEERLIQDLTHTTDLLVKSLHRPEYNRQRSELKESQIPIDQDLEQLFLFIHKSKKQLNNQRASFIL